MLKGEFGRDSQANLPTALACHSGSLALGGPIEGRELTPLPTFALDRLSSPKTLPAPKLGLFQLPVSQKASDFRRYN